MFPLYVAQISLVLSRPTNFQVFDSYTVGIPVGEETYTFGIFDTVGTELKLLFVLHLISR